MEAAAPLPDFRLFRLPLQDGMRLVLVIAAAVACASCGRAIPSGSPTDSDIRSAIERFYEKPHGALSQYDPNYLKGARIVSVRRCEAVDADYVCFVAFDRSNGGGQTARFVWLSKTGDRWETAAVTASRPSDGN